MNNFIPDELNEVQIGSLVEVLFQDGEKMEFTLTDSETANPSKGLISYASPLGRAIRGARVGDTRMYSVEKVNFQVKIIKIGEKKG